MENHYSENSRRQFLGSLGTAFAALGMPATLSAAQAATDAVARLTSELGYTKEGAREAVAFLLSNRYNQ